MKFAPPKACLVREVSERFIDCLRTRRVAIDMERAYRQHKNYCRCLETIVGHVAVVPPDRSLPDCCYIEDTAVVINRHAVSTRPGAPSRRKETGQVSAEIAGWCTVHKMQAPATLDGGDVMRVGATLWAGLSERTNEQGILFLRDIARRDGVDVVTVPVQKGLHLKSACTMVDGHTLIYDPDALDPRTLPHDNRVRLPAPEPLGANVLALGKTIIVSADAPKTSRLLQDQGFQVRSVDVSEFHKGDGALTCLSIRIPADNAWCA